MTEEREYYDLTWRDNTYYTYGAYELELINRWLYNEPGTQLPTSVALHSNGGGTYYVTIHTKHIVIVIACLDKKGAEAAYLHISTLIDRGAALNARLTVRYAHITRINPYYVGLTTIVGGLSTYEAYPSDVDGLTTMCNTMKGRGITTATYTLDDALPTAVTAWIQEEMKT